MYYFIIVVCGYMLVGCIIGIIFQKSTNNLLEDEDMMNLCMKIGRYPNVNALYDMIEFLDKWIMWIWPIALGIWIGSVVLFIRDLTKK